ncbi:uncharacterized protein [Prorops nasuta]
MENNHKNTDCYFFYYSTCKKGDSCAFRHEPSALGCETMCPFWQQGICFNEHCNFRHMELKKNRKLIPCYWETQPSGCRKPHCSFMHKNAKTISSDPINPVKSADSPAKPVNQDSSNRQADDTKYDGSSTESDQGRGSSEAGSFIGSPAVDPIIVKFEEESDNESAPSPVKPQPKVPYCKTYEEIRLEEIQAESAAYYSYQADDFKGDLGGGKIKRIGLARNSRKTNVYSRLGKSNQEEESNVSKSLDFQVLTLDAIRQRKKLKMEVDAAKQSSPIVTNPSDAEKQALSSTIINAKRVTLAREKPEAEEELVDCSQNVINTYAETSALDIKRGVKRNVCAVSNEEGESTNKQNLSERSNVKVPPVRLRRSCKRFAEGTLESLRPRRKAVPLPEAIERVASGAPDSSNEEGQISLDKTSDVEVRLCDSSTDESRTKMAESSIFFASKTTMTLVDEETQDTASIEDSIDDHKQMCDSLLNVNEDDYLMLDATDASDDILKDIDALLKDKTTA